MPYKQFSIPFKKVGEICNARVWLKGEKESYCSTKTEVQGIRCTRHKPKNIKEQTAELIASLDRQAIQDRVKELAQDESNLTELDNEILGLAAIIDDLEKMYHQVPYALERAETIGKLKRIKADLIEKKVNMDYKARVIMDADSVWGKISTVIDETVEDEGIRYKLKDKIMKVLDTMVESGAAQSKD